MNQGVETPGYTSEPEVDRYQRLAKTLASYTEKVKKSFVERANLDEETADLLALSSTFLYPASKLAGEAGEVAEKLAKLTRDKGICLYEDIPSEDRTALVKELGDVLWYVSDIASNLGVPLSQVMEANLEKLFGRKERGTLSGDGDDR